MRHRLIEGAIAVALALGAFVVPSGAAPVQAGTSCTGWSSTLIPPQTIRVYRTTLGRVDAVSFRTYVENVLANEWGPTTPPAALRAGAIAVKQYGWYYARTWRGGVIKGHCFDVRDSSMDQVYNPAKRVYAAARAAVTATWGISLRKGTRFFLTGYRPGSTSCTAHIDGWHLYQRDASACVKTYGDTTEQVLRRFYSSLNLVTAGLGDVTGDLAGDSPVVVTDPSSGDVTARLYSTDMVLKGSFATSSASPLAVVPTGDMLGRALGDLDADGRPDMVQLIHTSDGGLAVQVMRSTGLGFARAASWWSATPATAASAWTGTLRLVVGDFDGDYKADIGILRLVGSTDSAGPLAQLFVLTSTGSTVSAPRRAWTAEPAADLTGATFLAADVTGDGRADLVVLRDSGDPATPATAVEVARSSAKGLAQLTTWRSLAGVGPSEVRAIPTDLNLDGRADLYLALRGGIDEMTLKSIRSTGTGFSAPAAFTTDHPFSMSWSGTQLLASDVVRDGRPDLVVLSDGGSRPDGPPVGIVLTRLVTDGTTVLKVKPWLTDATVSYPSATLP